MTVCDRGEGGGQKSSKKRDILYGRPLTLEIPRGNLTPPRFFKCFLILTILTKIVNIYVFNY